jgi:hypothetical protein
MSVFESVRYRLLPSTAVAAGPPPAAVKCAVSLTAAHNPNEQVQRAMSLVTCFMNGARLQRVACHEPRSASERCSSNAGWQSAGHPLPPRPPHRYLPLFRNTAHCEVRPLRTRSGSYAWRRSDRMHTGYGRRLGRPSLGPG